MPGSLLRSSDACAADKILDPSLSLSSGNQVSTSRDTSSTAAPASWRRYKQGRGMDEEHVTPKKGSTYDVTFHLGKNL